MDTRTAADSRYPYTYAADLLRSCASYDRGGCNISRAEASQIRHLFAQVLGVDDEELARKLADYYLKHKDELAKESTAKFMTQCLGLSIDPANCEIPGRRTDGSR